MENLPQSPVFENVTIAPNGKTSAVLEGRWDDIYVTLINIRNDGRLVPYAHHPVDLPDGRIQLQVDLTPAAPPARRIIPVNPERPKGRIPRPSSGALQATGIGLVAVAGSAALAGLVWVAITVVPAVISFVAAWFWPALVLGVVALGAGAAMESSHRKTATQEEEPSIYPPGYSPLARQTAEPQAPTEVPPWRHWLRGTPQKSKCTIKPVAAPDPVKHHWFSGKPIGTQPAAGLSIEEEEAAAEAKAEARDVARGQRHWFSGKSIEEQTHDVPAPVKYHWFSGKPISTQTQQGRCNTNQKSGVHTPAVVTKHHWLSGKPIGTQAAVGLTIEEAEAMAEAQAEARDVEREQRYWWGGRKPEDLKTDELTTRILTRLRDKDSGQAFGAWTGGPYASAMAEYYGDAQTAYTMHGEDRCGVQWMMHEVDPKDDRAGKKHGAWDYINDRYGKKTVKNIIQMNDSGTRLPKIADYLEEQERRRTER